MAIEHAPIEELLRAFADLLDSTPRVYLAGPIDYTDGSVEHLPASLGVEVWCPKCRAADVPAGVRGDARDEMIMAQNFAAIWTCDFMLASLGGAVSIGTPVEVGQMVAAGRAGAVCIIHEGDPGLFVRHWRNSGAAVVRTREEAISWLSERIA